MISTGTLWSAFGECADISDDGRVRGFAVLVVVVGLGWCVRAVRELSL